MKVVVVTGGARGLGLAITSKLLAENYRVLVVGRKHNPVFLQLQSQYGDQLAFETYDFNNTAGIHELATRIGREQGRIYGLVNNAALGHDGILATMHERQIEELVRVNIQAPILLTKYLVRSMLLNGQGRIVNISSIMASTGFSGLTVYGATKAALCGFTQSLAREVGKAGVTVNTVAPGYLHTDMTISLQDEKLETIRRRSPMGELAGVEDVAEGVAFLLSDAASKITGTTLTIDAGSTA